MICEIDEHEYKPGEFIKDDMLFKPYEFGGYQALIDTPSGQISVRFGGHGLFTSESGPYEVRYPDGEVRGCQTSDDIFTYVKSTIKEENKEA